MRLRLLVHGPADGAVNMSVDEALLDSATKPDAGPSLRVYRFETPTLTIGYGQRLSEAVNETACRRHGIDCIRRITGGRALIHQHELTYSFAAPRQARSVRSAYRLVTGAIRCALERLGVPVDPPGRASSSRAPARLPCLAVPTGHEITARGRKIVASAMRFRRDGFLVHGSVLWEIDEALWRQLTPLGADLLSAVGIRELAGPELGDDELGAALSRSFEQFMGTSAATDGLTASETERAVELEAKYRSEEWNRRGRRGPRALPPTGPPH